VAICPAGAFGITDQVRLIFPWQALANIVGEIFPRMPGDAMCVASFSVYLYFFKMQGLI